jgi:hypothetical protein
MSHFRRYYQQTGVPKFRHNPLFKQGADYGWPECYFDGLQNKLVLAPEYGGDGGEKVGVCAERTRQLPSSPPIGPRRT